MKVLVTGIASKLGRMVGQCLVDSGHTVLGLDRRRWPDPPAGVEMFRVDVRKRPAEDVFRTRRPDVAVHMATTTHFSTTSEERLRINLHGTQRFFEHCHKYEVPSALFVGRHTVYGAAPDAPLYYTEADPPLAVATFPELADLVAADLYASATLWRFPEISTAVLRMVYTLGPSRRGTLANFLSGRLVPIVMGFDPLFHFMHEQDAARAIVWAVEQRIRGVFNVAGPQPVPLSLLCKVTGKRAAYVPEVLFPLLMGRFGFPGLPPGSLNHVKYPVVVDGRPFCEATGFAHVYDEVQTMEAYHWPD